MLKRADCVLGDRKRTVFDQVLVVRDNMKAERLK